MPETGSTTRSREGAAMMLAETGAVRQVRPDRAGRCGRIGNAGKGRNGMTQWIRFERNGRVGFGTLEDGTIAVHTGDMLSGAKPSGESVQLADVRVLTPVEPSKMVCLWNNFHQLAAKNDFPVPEEPLYFLKA